MCKQTLPFVNIYKKLSIVYTSGSSTNRMLMNKLTKEEVTDTCYDMDEPPKRILSDRTQTQKAM